MIPFSWLLEDVCIFYQPFETSSKPVLLLFNVSSSLLVKNSEKEVKIPFKSQYFPLSSTVSFALNLYVFTCKPNKAATPLQYLLSLNPPFCFKNMLFSDLMLTTSDSQIKIEPTRESYLYSQVKKSAPLYQWAFLKDNHTTVYSRKQLLTNESSTLDFYMNEDIENTKAGPACTITFEANDFKSKYLAYYDKFQQRHLKFSSSLSKYMLVYSPYMVINRTGIQLTVGCGKKRKDLEIGQHSSEYFAPKEKGKLYCKTDDYDWSCGFDMNTVGVQGSLALKCLNRKQTYKPLIRDYNSEEIEVGVTVSYLDNVFFKTIAITFVPRYVITNWMSTSIILYNEGKGNSKQHLIAAQQEKIYFLESKDKRNFVKIRLPSEKEASGVEFEDANKAQGWSSQFEI